MSGASVPMKNRLRLFLMKVGRPARRNPRSDPVVRAKIGVFSVADGPGFFHAESGANESTRITQTRARAVMRGSFR